MDTFRRCLSSGKIQEKFVRLTPGYGSFILVIIEELYMETVGNNDIIPKRKKVIPERRKKGTISDYIEYVDTLEHYVLSLIEKANSLLPDKKLSDISKKELGIDISEDIVAAFILPIRFGCIEKKMPYKNIGYDFIVRGGYKIQIKSGILLIDRWSFKKSRHDDMSDYFLCIGYDNRFNKRLRIRHIWLIPKDDVDKKNTRKSINIHNSPKFLLEFQKYENFL